MTRILVAVCALAIGAAASAQENENALAESAVGFSFRLGGFFPVDSKLRDIDNVFVNFGMEYDLPKSLLKNGTTYLAGDWASKTILGGQHVANATINQRFYTKDQRFAAGGSPYFFLGLGGEWTHVASRNGSTWCVRGGVGSEFRGDYFAEIAGVFSPKAGGVNPSGLSASIGYRFKN